MTPRSSILRRRLSPTSSHFKYRGFTLIELLTVIVLLSVTAAIFSGATADWSEGPKMRRTESLILSYLQECRIQSKIKFISCNVSIVDNEIILSLKNGKKSSEVIPDVLSGYLEVKAGRKIYFNPRRNGSGSSISIIGRSSSTKITVSSLGRITLTKSRVSG